LSVASGLREGEGLKGGNKLKKGYFYFVQIRPFVTEMLCKNPYDAFLNICAYFQQTLDNLYW